MTEPPRSGAANAGLMLLCTILLCAAAGFGLGVLVGLPVPLGLAGLFVGAVAGFGLVYARFKDL
jgi:hypothetical protein